MNYESFREQSKVIKSAVIPVADSQLRSRIDQYLWACSTVVSNPRSVLFIYEQDFKLKRIFDVVSVLAAIFFLWPILLLLVCLIRIKLGAPVFFTQIRPGMHGNPFCMIKFRTMTDARNSQGQLLPDADRLRPFGQFLRSTSLDELPGLWSVLKGDMSLVGPRPLLMEYLPLYSPKQARRHEVRPGITGWAQVNGRNAISWEEKFKLDVWYVDNRSLCLDIKILLMTVKKVLVREGISATGEATMTPFRGSIIND